LGTFTQAYVPLAFFFIKKDGIPFLLQLFPYFTPFFFLFFSKIPP